MRKFLVVAGIGVISAYAFLGAMVMNNWAPTAASGLPLPATISAISEGGESYSTIPGVIFAAAGMSLAVLWGYRNLSASAKLSGWGSLATWAGIMALGAPAYFVASIWNMMSVGDVFFDWDSAAAFNFEQPLYITSGVAVLITIVAILARPSRRYRPQAA